MKDSNFRDFIVAVTNIDGKEIGSVTLHGMGKDNEFIDIIRQVYYDRIKYANIGTVRLLDEEDFTVEVYKVDLLGRKRLVDLMTVCCEGDSTFEQVIDLAYHGCTDD